MPNGSAGPDENLRRAHGQMFGRVAATTLPATRSVVQLWQPDLVVSERAEFAGPIAAAEHGKPLVDMRWGVADLPEYRSSGAEVLAGELARLGLTGLPEPDLLLTPWPPSLRLPHAAGHYGLRHVSYNGIAQVPDWMLRPRSVHRISLTLGTLMPQLGPDLLRAELLTAVRELVHRGFDVVLAVDERTVDAWGPWPAGVRHVGWMPMGQLLRASDLLIHHGGHGTTLTALEAGVPQLVLPQFDDQFENADAVAKAGAGTRMLHSEIVPEAVVGHCVRLLESAEVAAAAAELAGEIATQPSPFQVVTWLEALAERQ